MKQIEIILDEMAIPYRFRKFEEDTVCPPYMVYYLTNSSPFSADGKVYFKADTLIIELYSDEVGLDIEKRIENVLDLHGIYYEAQREYIEEECLYETIYGMEVILT